MPPPGAAVQRPLQQASPVAQVSPSTRHPASSTQVMTPLSLRSAQPRPQHSSAFMQVSPAGRQSAAIAHMLRHASAAAAVLSGDAGASRGAAARAAANAGGASQSTAGPGVRATLLVRRTTGRVCADACPRPRRIRRADERTAVGARHARRAFRAAGGRLATPAGASSRTAIGSGLASASVGDAVREWRRARNRQLDLAAAAAGQRHQRQRDRDAAAQGRVPSPASRRAPAAASPRGNSRR